MLAIHNCYYNMQNTIAIQHYEIMNAIQMGDCITQALLYIHINAIHNRHTQENIQCIIVLNNATITLLNYNKTTTLI